MNKQYRLLKLYELGLRLYPKNFREAYGAQVLLTVRDTLDVESTKTGIIRIYLRLAVDLLGMALIGNVRHMEEHMTKSSKKTSVSSALSAALFGAQIVGVTSVSYVYLYGTLQAITLPRAVDTSLVTWYLDSIMPSVVFAIILGLAFTLVRKILWLSRWSRITWSYGFWLCGVVGYAMFGSAIDSLLLYYAPNGIPGVAGVALGLGYGQIVTALIFLAGFYLLVRRFVKLLEASRATVKIR